jgi:hypothetical protein
MPTDEQPQVPYVIHDLYSSVNKKCNNVMQYNGHMHHSMQKEGPPFQNKKEQLHVPRHSLA